MKERSLKLSVNSHKMKEFMVDQLKEFNTGVMPHNAI